jgi:hypothetical protein
MLPSSPKKVRLAKPQAPFKIISTNSVHCNLSMPFGLLILELLSMKEIVDRVMRSARATSISNLSQTELRNKVGNYVKLLSSAGKRDSDELIDLGVAYLHDIIDGPDPRYTGC